MEYADLMNKMYERAEVVGLEHPDDAWLMINEVWWPNPYYDGVPVVHPECSTEFHPQRR